MSAIPANRSKAAPKKRKSPPHVTPSRAPTKPAKKPAKAATKKDAARKTAKKVTASRRTTKKDEGAWLWALFATLRDVLVDNPPKKSPIVDGAWGDPNVPNVARALLMLYRDGAAAVAEWPKNPEDHPPAPPWFDSWEGELERTRNAVDFMRPAWHVVAGEGTRDLNIYHLEVRTEPGKPFTQVVRARRKVRSGFARNIGRLGQIEAIVVRPERDGGRADFPVIDGRQRCKARRALNLDLVRDWWAEFRAGPGAHRQRPPVLQLLVPCKLIHCDDERSEEIGASLNSQRMQYTKLEIVEEALRLKALRKKPAEIAEILEISQSTYHSYALVLKLHATLQALFWSEVLPFAVAFELARLEKDRQLAIWATIKDKGDKLLAFREAIGGAAPRALGGRKAAAVVRRVQDVGEAAKRAVTTEGILARDLLAALQGDDEALLRLPAEVRAFVDLTSSGGEAAVSDAVSHEPTREPDPASDMRAA